MKKYILKFSILLIVIMNFAIFTPIGALADNSYTVSINDRLYETIQEAVGEADSGQTIDIISDGSKIVLGSTLEIINKENLTINLNGAALSGNNENRVVYISQSNVTIKNGSITEGRVEGNLSPATHYVGFGDCKDINVGGGILIDNRIKEFNEIENFYVNLININMDSNASGLGSAIFQNGGHLVFSNDGEEQKSIISNNFESVDSKNKPLERGGVFFINKGKTDISNTVFVNNSIKGDQGAGLYISNLGEATLENVVFTENKGLKVSALYCMGKLTATNCEFSKNNGFIDGTPDTINVQSVIRVNNGSGSPEVKFKECNVIDNLNSYYTLNLENGDTTFENCTIKNNKAFLVGGICTGSSSESKLTLNKTNIINNSANLEEEYWQILKVVNDKNYPCLVGGIENKGTEIILNESTVNSNKANFTNSQEFNDIDISGGIYFHYKNMGDLSVSLTESTIKNNEANINSGISKDSYRLSGGILTPPMEGNKVYKVILNSGAIYNNKSNDEYKDIYFSKSTEFKLLEANKMSIKPNDFHQVIEEDYENKNDNNSDKGDSNPGNDSGDDAKTDEESRGEDFIQDVTNGNNPGNNTGNLDNPSDDKNNSSSGSNTDNEGLNDETILTDYFWVTPELMKYDPELNDYPITWNNATPLELTVKKIIDNQAIEVNGKKVKSLEEALKELQDNPNNNIKLIGNTDLNNLIELDSVDIESSITVELNNCRVVSSFGKTSQIFNIKEKGSLTLVGPGELNGQISNAGKIILNGNIPELNIKLLNESSNVCLDENYYPGGVINIVLNEELLERLNSLEEITNIDLVTGVKSGDLVSVNLVNVESPFIKLGYDPARQTIWVNKELPNGIFVDQNGDESPNERKFKTMEEAISCYDQIQGEKPIIYIVENYKLTQNEDWESEALNPPTIKRFSAHKNQKKTNIITVDGNNFLTLTNILIEGNSEEPDSYYNCGSLIHLKDKATLIINDKTILANNDISDKLKSEHYEFNSKFFGGAIKANNNSQIIINGGTITNCTAILGGAIYSTDNTTIEMNAGLIDNNTAIRKIDIYSNGGGICLRGNSQMILKGGTISNNIADQGGGISLGSLNSNSYKNSNEKEIVNLKISKEDESNSNDINISDNTSNYSGGGIFVQCQYTAEIRDGKFKNNKCRSGNFGGGAIYVNGGKSGYSDGIARLYNVLVNDNHAVVSGAGIASCGTSNTHINISDGSAIFGNTLVEGKAQPIPKANVMDDIAIETDNGIVEEYDKIKARDFIPRFMFDKTPYQWKNYDTQEYATEDYLSSETGKHLYTEAKPSNTNLRVQITNNSAAYRGGGIGSNGTVFIGDTDPDTDSIKVTKHLKGFDDKSEFTNDVNKINVWLLGLKEDGSYSLITSKVLYENKDWINDDKIVTFKELPQGYLPIVLEEVIYEDNLHVFSDNNDPQGLLSVVNQIMKTYPETHQFVWAGSYKAPFDNYTDNDGEDFTLINIKSDSPESKYAIISLNGSKILNGAAIEDYNDQFSFSLELVEGNSNGIDGKLTTQVNNKNYNFSFGTITFKEEGTYKFEVKEFKGSDSSIDYDKTVFTVIVDVKEVGGKLVAEKTITVNDENREGIVFVNNKIVEPEEITSGLTVSKILDSDYIIDYSKLFRFNVYLTSSKLGDSVNNIQYRIINKKTDRVDKELTPAQLSLLNGQWLFTIDLADGQTVEIVNLPTDTKYQVLEDQQSAFEFESFSTSYQGNVPADGGWAHVAYTNSRRENKEVGSLILQKLVEAKDIDQSQQFKFIVNIMPKQTGQFGNVTFVDGQATVSLRHLQSVVISNLPIGTTYTIQEESLADYTTTWSQVADLNNIIRGQITENNSTAFVTCINKKTNETIEETLKPEMSIVKKQSLTFDNYTDQYVQYDEDNNLITYEITVKNTGKVSATNVVITDSVPEGTILVDGSLIPDGNVDNNVLSWSFEELKPGEEITVYFTVEVLSEVEQVENTANLTYTEDPPMDSNKVTAGTNEDPQDSTEAPEWPTDTEPDSTDNNEDSTNTPQDSYQDSTESPSGSDPADSTNITNNNNMSTTTADDINRTNTTSSTTSTVKSTSVTNISPKTGVVATTSLWLALVGLAGTGLVVNQKKNKKK